MWPLMEPVSNISLLLHVGSQVNGNQTVKIDRSVLSTKVYQEYGDCILELPKNNNSLFPQTIVISKNYFIHYKYYLLYIDYLLFVIFIHSDCVPFEDRIRWMTSNGETKGLSQLYFTDLKFSIFQSYFMLKDKMHQDIRKKLRNYVLCHDLY